MTEPNRAPRGSWRRRPERKQQQFRKRLRAYRSTRERPRRQIPRAAVPSFFTLMNLFCGYLSIIQTLEGRFDYACYLIVVAGFFDALDGMMARLTNGQSLFGVELDSLSDIVSFGVAPAFLVYEFGLKDFGALGLVVSSLPAICGAVRLARFNINFDGEKKDYFDGLPIPVQAIAIVAIILNVNDAALLNRLSSDNLSLLIPTVFVLSGLMVSNISFDAIPKPSAYYIRTHPKKSLAYGLATVLILFWIPEGLLVSLAVYLLSGIGLAIYKVGHAVWTTPIEEGSQDEAAS